MKKCILFAAAIILLAGCATIVPVAKLDWTGVNSADQANLKAGKIALAPEAVLDAAADALKSEGWEIDKAAGSASTVMTVRKHGVTVYGSCDYAMSCRAAADNGLTKIDWTVISYVTQFLTNVDPVNLNTADRWNIAVYGKLIDKGLIKKDKAAEPTAVPAAEKTAAVTGAAEPVVDDKDLPAPPREEQEK